MAIKTLKEIVNENNINMNKKYTTQQLQDITWTNKQKKNLLARYQEPEKQNVVVRSMATVDNAVLNVLKGFFNTTEGIADTFSYLIADVEDFFGADDWAERTREQTKKDVINDMFNKSDAVQAIEGQAYNSKANQIANQIFYGAGNVMAMAGGTSVLGGAGFTEAPSTIMTSFTSAYGNATSEALRNGDDLSTARKKGFINGTAEAISEQMFDALPGMKAYGWGEEVIGKTGSLVKKYFGTKAGQVAMKVLKHSGEGFEEIVSNFLTSVGNDIMYLTDKKNFKLENPFKQLYSKDSWEQFLYASLTSAFTNRANTFVTTQQKNSILKAYAKDNGITFDEAKKQFNQAVQEKTEVQKSTMSGTNLKQETELEDENKIKTLKEIMEGTFVEPGTETQTYQYKASDNELVNAMNQSIVDAKGSNDYKTRSAAELATKIIEDLNVPVVFTNNEQLQSQMSEEQLKETQGRTINGFVGDDGKMYLNLDSDELASFTVGHETKHFFESNKDMNDVLNKALKDYAVEKGVYDTDLKEITALYTDKNGRLFADPETELMADYVGKFFTDEEFVRNLSTKNPSLFQRIKDYFEKLYLRVTNQKEKLLVKEIKDTINKAYRQYAEMTGGKVAATEERLFNETTEQKKARQRGQTKQQAKQKAVLPVAKNVEEKKENVLPIKEKTQEKPEVKKETKKETKKVETKKVEKKETKKEQPKKVETKEKTTLKEVIDEDLFNIDTKEIENQFDKKTYNLNEDEGTEYEIDGTNFKLKDGNILEISTPYTYNKKTLDKIYQNEIDFTIIDENDNVIDEYSIKGEDNNFTKEDIIKAIKHMTYDDSNKVAEGQIDMFDNVHRSSGIKYSLSEDNEGRKLTKEQIEFFKDSKARDSEGRLKQLYHGTATGEFYTFDKTMANPEGDWGKSIYLTDNEDDVSRNYEDGGADFDNRISRLAEQIEQEEDISYDEAKEKAKNQLYKGSYKITAYADIKNPAIVGETKLFEYNDEDIAALKGIEREDYDTDEDYEEAMFYARDEQIAEDVEEALWAVEREYDLDYYKDDIRQAIYEAIAEDDGVEIQTLKDKISEAAIDVGDEQGKLISNDIARIIIESQGYDGIIDPTVSTKWNNMNVEEGTTHYLAFNENQIKDINNENPTDNPDIRYSISREGETRSEKYDTFYKPKVESKIRLSDLKKKEVELPIAEKKVATTSQKGAKSIPLIKDKDVIKVEINNIAKQINEKGDFDIKSRGWLDSIRNSQAIEDKGFLRGLDLDKASYQVQTNQKSVDTANEYIKRNGYDKSVSHAQDIIKSGKTPTASDVALLQRMTQEAIKNKDYATAQDLIMDTAVLGTDLGQAVQALSIIKKLTPEGQLKLYTKIVDRAKLRGEKSFKDVEITPDMVEKVLGAYNEDGTYDQDDLNARVEEFKQDIASQMKATVGDKVNAWRYLAMLGNPKTHIRNVVSNVAMKGTIKVKNAMARTLESVLPVKDRTKTWKKASNEIKDFAKNTAVEMKDIITGENKYNEKYALENEKQIFKTKALEKISNFNTNALETEDWLFSRSAFESTFREYLTANGINTMEDVENNPEIVEKGKIYAVEQSEIATFRQYSKLAAAISRLERNNKAAKYAVNAVLPFKKTPINVAKAGVNYSPLGLIKNMSYDLYQLKQGNINASQFIDNISQGLTGTSLALLGYGLAKAGILSGSGDDDKEDKYENQLGKQNYAINVGGKSYSISWLSPVAMPMLVGANAYEKLEEGEDWNADIIMDTLAQTLDPLSEMSFVSGLTDTLKSYNTGSTQMIKSMAETGAQSYILQFFPTIMSQFASTVDDKKRSTKVSNNSPFKFGEETLRKIMLKIPGLRNQLEVQTDIWGNEKEQSENIVTRAFESFLAPYSKTENTTSKLDKEILRLYNKTGENSVVPGIPYAYVKKDSETYRMSASEYTKYKETFGQTANNTLTELVNSDSYKQVSDEDKVKMIENVYKYAREQAKQQYFDSIKEQYSSKKLSKIEQLEDTYGISAADYYENVAEYNYASKNPERYLAVKAIGDYDTYQEYKEQIKYIKDTYKGSENTNRRKQAVYEYINSLPLSVEQKLILQKIGGGYSVKGQANRLRNYINSLDLSVEDKQAIDKVLFK